MVAVEEKEKKIEEEKVGMDLGWEGREDGHIVRSTQTGVQLDCWAAWDKNKTQDL